MFILKFETCEPDTPHPIKELTQVPRDEGWTIFSQILTWRTPLVLEELDQFKAPIIVVKVCRRSNVK